MRRISLIGIGRIGGALALALARRGFGIDAMVGRTSPGSVPVAGEISPPPAFASISDPISIESGTVIIATQDDQIRTAARWLGERLGGRRPVVLHTSGALGSEVLSGLGDLGCAVGSLHPLVSVADAFTGAERLAGAYYCVEGDPAAVEAAKEIVGALEGRSFAVAAGRKPLYHAAAVMACGHLVALVDAAVEMLCASGVDRAEAVAILTPLIRSTVENIASSDTVSALTGPFVRADAETIGKHLESIRGAQLDAVLDIYKLLGLRSLELASARGADAERLDMIREIILLAKSGSR